MPAERQQACQLCKDTCETEVKAGFPVWHADCWKQWLRNQYISASSPESKAALKSIHDAAFGAPK